MVFCFLWQSRGLAQPEDISDLFARQKSGLFIIEVADQASDNKNVIGSGFLLNEHGLIATNYHVVSSQTLYPEKYHLKYKDSDDNTGPLSVVAVDVINDLALVQMQQPEAIDFSRLWQFELAESLPEQGAEVVAMGNPYDIGISVVPGTYNGRLKKSYRQNIHFTGALNPGMSGGPAVNKQGQVIGVNVSGAGNSVSFLVPVTYLQALLDKVKTAAQADETQLKEQLSTELKTYQDELLDDLLAGDWTLSEFGPLKVPTAVRGYVDCSGQTTPADSDQYYDGHSSECGVNDYIFLSQRLGTGLLEWDYGWYVSDQLNQIQFYQMFEEVYFVAANQAGGDDVTGFQCVEDITQIASLPDTAFKSVYCVRSYLDYAGLYDVLYFAKSLLDRSEGIYLHYTLAGVTMTKAKAFNQRFLEALAWK
ncbi:MAG: hypothetical protein Tsb002_05310 [Wenzhouxiangellaceae bacterium]